MDFGFFTEFHVRDGRSEAEAFEEHFHEVEMADKMGLDSVWLGEYHFAPERSGLAVLVIPLANPIRIAEDAAIMDHVSKGRFEFGVGRSGLTQFYDGFNMDYGESRERFSEGLEVIKKAWTNETFSHEGKYWNFQDVTVVPKPYQKPHPPISVAVISPESFSNFGNMGYPISFSPLAPMPKPESTEGRPWGQPLKKPAGAPLNLG